MRLPIIAWPSPPQARQLTRYMAKEFAPRGIRVNSVALGPTRTRLGNDGFARLPEIIPAIAAETALKRLGEHRISARPFQRRCRTNSAGSPARTSKYPPDTRSNPILTGVVTSIDRPAQHPARAGAFSGGCIFQADSV